MQRPFASSRPIGPFSQMGSSKKLGLITNYRDEIPDGMRDEAAEAVSFHLEANDIPVSSVRVGPDNQNDSVMVIVSDSSFMLSDAQSAASASVAEMKDMGMSVGSNHYVEVITE